MRANHEKQQAAPYPASPDAKSAHLHTNTGSQIDAESAVFHPLMEKKITPMAQDRRMEGR
jgi:hypothetical protein